MTIASASAALGGLSAPSGADASSALSIQALRSAAARDPKAAIRETAKQFEALFMQQLMKSMREATMSSGMLDNSGTKLGTEMLDSQYAAKMSGLPGGLAAAIARQLERQLGSGAAEALGAPASAAGAPDS
jgi:flagellar protein FlgJ